MFIRVFGVSVKSLLPGLYIIAEKYAGYAHIDKFQCTPVSAGDKPRKQPRAIKKAPRGALFAVAALSRGSEAVVHVEFDRMGRHAQTRDILHLQFDVGIDHVIAEYATGGEELAILVKVIQRLVE
jgi:hypothetical protein